jgi:medium-chain acyl-[acyl-carrier-protein] hydrolase
MPLSQSQFFSGISKPHSKLRLFCFPHAGGGPMSFGKWVTTLPEAVEFHVIRLPGRETRLREKPYTHIEPLINDLANAIEPLLDKKFVFYGHSLGTLLAFETIRELRRRGARLPAHLIVSARRALYLPNVESDLHELPAAQFLGQLHERYGGIPVAILKDREMLKLFIPTLRADITVLETYSYVDEPLLDCPISAFGGLQDHMVSEAELEGWRALTKGRFELQMLDGNHFFIQQDRFIDILNKILLLHF